MLGEPPARIPVFSTVTITIAKSPSCELIWGSGGRVNRRDQVGLPRNDFDEAGQGWSRGRFGGRFRSLAHVRLAVAGIEAKDDPTATARQATLLTMAQASVVRNALGATLIQSPYNRSWNIATRLDGRSTLPVRNHGRRRTTASSDLIGRPLERDLSVADVAAGGWSDVGTLIRRYQQADDDTLLTVTQHLKKLTSRAQSG